MGLKGAAIAACSAQIVGAMTCLGIFFLSRSMAAYRAAQWRLSLTRFRPLFRIGTDLAIRTGALRGSLVFATSCAARMGTNILSAHEIAFQLMLLGSDVIDGLAVAGQTLVAKYLGSAQKEKAYAMGKTLILCGAVAGLIFGIAFLGAQDAIVTFFTNSIDVKLLLGGGAILLVALFQPLNGIVFVLDGLLISTHDTRFLMWAMLHRQPRNLCTHFLDVSALGLGSNRNLGRSRRSDVLAAGHVALSVFQRELVGGSEISGSMRVSGRIDLLFNLAAHRFPFQRN